MKRMVRFLPQAFLTAVLLGSGAAFAQGPSVPPTPTDPSGIPGFLQALEQILRDFVEGLVGALPV
ncbi:MAG: hypothetical protein HY509_02640 [Acidobacteria bacterium]|nr:hypothetical protein [Acidobacteriota bacterium]